MAALGLSSVWADLPQTNHGAEKEISGNTEFMDAVGRCGGIVNDLSGQQKIKLAEPSCGYVNFTGFSAMPESKTAAIKGWVEFFDGEGNYFRKRIIAGAQGSSSLGYPKKNLKIDFCEDEWIGDDTPDITFGDWVKQNGFHLKAYYIDYFRGVGAVSYKIYEDVISDRGDMARPWQRVGVDGVSSGALGHPDGFPVAVYLNGDFYGVFAWQLKKHRKNMGMDKDNPAHIHLDGEITTVSLFNQDIDWTKFEIRNPKGLCCMDGKKYDGDDPREIIDENSPCYDASNEDHVRTAQVKKNIVSLSRYCYALDRLRRSGLSDAQMREEFARRFDVDGFIDYTVFSSIVNNVDGWWKNWQWITYDGTMWHVMPYDLDMTFGNVSFGHFVSPPEYNWFYEAPDSRFVIPVGPAAWLHEYFAADLDERYATLRDSQAITAEKMIDRVEDWYTRVGEEMYEKEYTRWPDSFCNRDLIVDAAWEWAGTWVGLWSYPEWNGSHTYRKGEMCQAGNMLWKAVELNKGKYPVIQFGYHDGMDRISDWIEKRIAIEDRFWNYTSSGVDGVYDDGSGVATRQVVSICDISGIERPALSRGLNIVRYSDGSVVKILE